MKKPLPEQLSAMTGAIVEDNPYDIGYWSRVAGLPRPTTGSQSQRGWDTADRELREEQAHGEAQEVSDA